MEVFDLDQINVQLLQKSISSNDIFLCTSSTCVVGESNGCTDFCEKKKSFAKNDNFAHLETELSKSSQIEIIELMALILVVL